MVPRKCHRKMRESGGGERVASFDAAAGRGGLRGACGVRGPGLRVATRRATGQKGGGACACADRLLSPAAHRGGAKGGGRRKTQVRRGWSPRSPRRSSHVRQREAERRREGMISLRWSRGRDRGTRGPAGLAGMRPLFLCVCVCVSMWVCVCACTRAVGGCAGHRDEADTIAPAGKGAGR